MRESEKAALRERFEQMSVDEKLFELAVGIYDPERTCQTVRNLRNDIHGNGKTGIADEVKRLRWTVYALAVIAASWKLLPLAVGSLLGER